MSTRTCRTHNNYSMLLLSQYIFRTRFFVIEVIKRSWKILDVISLISYAVPKWYKFYKEKKNDRYTSIYCSALIEIKVICMHLIRMAFCDGQIQQVLLLHVRTTIHFYPEKKCDSLKSITLCINPKSKKNVFPGNIGNEKRALHFFFVNSIKWWRQFKIIDIELSVSMNQQKLCRFSLFRYLCISAQKSYQTQ